MKYKIVCEECNEIIGTLIKEQVTDEDKDSYKNATTCSSGHLEKITLIEDEA